MSMNTQLNPFTAAPSRATRHFGYVNRLTDGRHAFGELTGTYPLLRQPVRFRLRDLGFDVSEELFGIQVSFRLQRRGMRGWQAVDLLPVAYLDAYKAGAPVFGKVLRIESAVHQGRVLKTCTWNLPLYRQYGFLELDPYDAHVFFLYWRFKQRYRHDPRVSDPAWFTFKSTRRGDSVIEFFPGPDTARVYYSFAANGVLYHCFTEAFMNFDEPDPSHRYGAYIGDNNEAVEVWQLSHNPQSAIRNPQSSGASGAGRPSHQFP